MRYFLLLPIFVLTIFLFISCGTESTPTYTLTTSVVGEGTITPSGGTYEEGETVTITSTPSEHWVFNDWSGDGSGNSSTVTITMDSDKNVVGNFSERLYPLNITYVGEGTVTEEVIQSKIEHTFGTVVQLTPVPETGWKFVEWSGGVTSTDEVVTVTVDGEVNVSVTFERIDYPLTINIEGEGEVEQEVVQSKTTEYPYETVVQLKPVPSNGWFFWNYKGDLSWNTVPQNIVVDEDKNVTITFIRKGTIDELLLYSYDSNNNLIEQIQYNSDGSISWRWTYSYDSNSNPIEWIRYQSDGSISFRQTYSYDSNNNRIEQIRYNSDGSISLRVTNSYDSNNNRIEQIQYNSDGAISFRLTYSYDSNNNRIEIIGYNSSGSISFRQTYSYDSNNNLIEVIRYNPDGSIFFRDTYSYDSNNNFIEWIWYSSDGSIYIRQTYSYDSNNNRIEIIGYNSNGSIYSKWTYSYDSNNNLIDRFRYDFVSNTSNSTIQIDPFNDLERYKIEPYDELPLNPHQLR